MLKKLLIASFGFDIDFVLKKLASEKYDRVVLVALKTQSGFERVRKAYSMLSIICNSLKLDCVLETIPPGSLSTTIYSLLEREIETSDEVEVYLTGGPRILVVSLLTSALMLLDTKAVKTRIVVEGEGFECTMKINLSLLLTLLKLDEKDKLIVENLRNTKYTLAEVSKRTGIPKTTLYRRTEELIEKGLVVKTERETYLVEDPVEIVCSE